MIAAVFEFIAEERCRQRCVDKAGGDEVGSDGRELLHTHAAQPRSVIRSAFCQEKPFGVPSISRDGAHLVYTEVENAANHIVLRPNGPIRSPGYPVLSLDNSGKTKPLISAST